MCGVIIGIILCIICPQVAIPAIVIGIIAGIIQVYLDSKKEKEQARKAEEDRIERERLAQEEAKKREEARKQWEAIEKENRAKHWQLQKNLAVIDQMDGHEFEWFIAKVLAKIGFQNVRVTKASGDYGVDIIAYDNGVKCAFQCKRYSGTLGLQPIQEVSAGAGYYGASRAYVITNSHFSENARNLADRLGVKLWDRNSLNYLINKINEFERKEREVKDGTD